MYLSRTWSVPACGIVLLALAGCDEGNKVKLPDVSPAAGVVTYNGEPVDGAQVMLYSEESKGNGWACGGFTDESGKFEMSTTVGPNKVIGIPAGNYVAVVTKLSGESTEDKEEAYKAKIAAGGDPAKIREEFEKEAPKAALPAKYGDEKISDLKVKIDASGNTEIELKLVD
jgi:hypothetical protein